MERSSPTVTMEGNGWSWLVIMPPDTRINFCCLHTSVRGVQLFGWIRLQGDGKVLQRVGSSRRMGLFWWIQQDWIRGEWTVEVTTSLRRRDFSGLHYTWTYYLMIKGVWSLWWIWRPIYSSWLHRQGIMCGIKTIIFCLININNNVFHRNIQEWQYMC